MPTPDRIMRIDARALMLVLLLASTTIAVLPQIAKAQQQQAIAIDLPAGNLAAALNRLATQSGLPASPTAPDV